MSKSDKPNIDYLAERDRYKAALERIVAEGIDTSTGGGLNFVREVLAKGGKE